MPQQTAPTRCSPPSHWLWLAVSWSVRWSCDRHLALLGGNGECVAGSPQSPASQPGPERKWLALHQGSYSSIHIHRAGGTKREEDAETKSNIVTEAHRLMVWITPMQMTLRFLGLHSTLRLLQKGTSQLAHWHACVELRSVESERDFLTLNAGRVLAGGGGSEGKEVRVQKCGSFWMIGMFKHKMMKGDMG